MRSDGSGRDDEGAGALAEAGVGHRDDGGLAYGGVAQEQELDLLGVDLLPATVDDVLDPPLDEQVLLALERAPARQVAGAVEAVAGEGGEVVLGSGVVAGDRVGPTAAELADLAVGHGRLGPRSQEAHLVERR